MPPAARARVGQVATTSVPPPGRDLCDEQSRDSAGGDTADLVDAPAPPRGSGR